MIYQTIFIMCFVSVNNTLIALIFQLHNRTPPSFATSMSNHPQFYILITLDYTNFFLPSQPTTYPDHSAVEGRQSEEKFLDISGFFHFVFFLMLYIFKFLLVYNLFTMLYYFWLYSMVNQLYIHINSLFFRFFSYIDHYRVLIRVSCVLYSRSFLVIYFIYSSMYLSIPISQFIPPLISSLETIRLFSASVTTLFLFCK